MKILQTHQREHGLPLPPVIGMVLHKGPKKWTVSTELHDLFNLPADLAPDLLPYLPGMRHALLDLSQTELTQSEGNGRLQIVLKLMKLAREKELMEFFQWLATFDVSVQKRFPDSLLSLSLLYALHSDHTLDIQAISSTIENSKHLSKITINAVEKLIEQGKIAGLAEGKAEGKAEGEAKGKAEGEEKGVWIGRIQLLQEFLGDPETPLNELSALRLEQLREKYALLQKRYDSDFKK